MILASRPASSGVWDDFDRDASGNTWITTHPNSMTEVTSGGTQSNILGPANTLVQPTSARMGRGSQTGTLWVVSAGNGTVSGQLASMSV